jgi:hypothetical protein
VYARKTFTDVPCCQLNATALESSNTGYACAELGTHFAVQQKLCRANDDPNRNAKSSNHVLEEKIRACTYKARKNDPVK